MIPGRKKFRRARRSFASAADRLGRAIRWALYGGKDAELAEAKVRWELADAFVGLHAELLRRLHAATDRGEREALSDAATLVFEAFQGFEPAQAPAGEVADIERFEQHIDHGLIPLKGGQWVRFSDHRAWLIEKDREIERVRRHERETAEVAARNLEKAEERAEQARRERDEAREERDTYRTGKLPPGDPILRAQEAEARADQADRDLEQEEQRVRDAERDAGAAERELIAERQCREFLADVIRAAQAAEGADVYTVLDEGLRGMLRQEGGTLTLPMVKDTGSLTEECDGCEHQRRCLAFGEEVLCAECVGLRTEDKVTEVEQRNAELQAAIRKALQHAVNTPGDAYWATIEKRVLDELRVLAWPPEPPPARKGD